MPVLFKARTFCHRIVLTLKCMAWLSEVSATRGFDAETGCTHGGFGADTRPKVTMPERFGYHEVRRRIVSALENL